LWFESTTQSTALFQGKGLMPWIWIKVLWDDWKWRKRAFNGDLFHRSSVVCGFPVKNLSRGNDEEGARDRKLLRLLQKRNRILQELVGQGNKDS
jgi:hypothetical protein